MSSEQHNPYRPPHTDNNSRHSESLPRVVPATLSYRATALLIDLGVVSSLGTMAHLLANVLANRWSVAPLSRPPFTIIWTLIVYLVYFGIGDSHRRFGTLGKRMLGIRVLRQSQNDVGLLRALVRSSLRYLLFPYIGLLSSEAKQGITIESATRLLSCSIADHRRNGAKLVTLSLSSCREESKSEASPG